MTSIACILPNYNHAAFLPQRLGSIAAQIRQPGEILLMDDCSRDDSRTLLNQFAADHPHARTLFNDRNSGSTFRQWNKGIANVSADYVWIAESDDFCEPTLVERLAGVLDAHPHVGVVSCESMEVDAAGVPQNVTKQQWINRGQVRWANDFISRGTDEVADILLNYCTVQNASAVMFRRELYLAEGGADERLRLAGDWDLWTRLIGASGFAWIAQPLNSWRHHAGTVRSATRGFLTAEENYRVTLRIIRRFAPPLEKAERALANRARLWTHAVSDSRDIHAAAESYERLCQLDRTFAQRAGREVLRRLRGRIRLFGDQPECATRRTL